MCQIQNGKLDLASGLFHVLQYFFNPKVAKEPVPPQLELIVTEILTPLITIFHRFVDKVSHSVSFIENFLSVHLPLKVLILSRWYYEIGLFNSSRNGSRSRRSPSYHMQMHFLRCKCCSRSHLQNDCPVLLKNVSNSHEIYRWSRTCRLLCLHCYLLSAITCVESLAL